MNPAIPARRLVSVLPGVLAAGGNPLSLNAVVLTADTSVPIDTVASFPSADAVADFFGPESREAAIAAIYFAGYDTSTTKPSELFFAQFNTGAVAAYLRSGSFEGVTLSQLQALSGTLIIEINGTPYTTGSINLSGASSFSNAATLIQAALVAQLASTTCVYDSQLNAFVITSPTTGDASTIDFSAGTLATGLKVTEATGAVTSQGAAIAVPATALDAITDTTQNWASFMTVFEPNTASKLAFAAWTNGTSDRYVYVAWDSTVNVTQGSQPDSFGAQCATLEYDGICPIYDPTGDIAAFICGAIASIDFAQTQGRITFAYKGQAGLAATITSETAAAFAEGNGYNYYGDFATANDQFVMFQTGSTPGAWKWLDSYVNQIWLNNALQLAFMVLLTRQNSIPYNQQGYNMLRAAAADPIDAALNAGVIQPGIPLSNSQRSYINTSVGGDAAQVVVTLGWYLDIKDATPEQRALRASPPMTLYYTDGGSIQQIELSSIEVQ
jgi:Protein of unknown function (DUF3383)